MVCYDSSCNEESVRRLGSTLSARSRQVRAKRININLKVNALAYLVEVIGGLLLFGASCISTGKKLFPVAFWYGLVVPSCSLVNNDETKMLIMKHGWTTVLRSLFAKKGPRNPLTLSHPTSSTAGVETKNNKEAAPRAPEIPGKIPLNAIEHGEAPKNTNSLRISTSKCSGKKLTNVGIGVFYISGNPQTNLGSKTHQETLPLFHPRPHRCLKTNATPNNAGNITVVDM